MNQHGQQLSIVGLIWRQRRLNPIQAKPASARRRYPLRHEQLTLVHVPRDLTRLRIRLSPPDPGFAWLLDHVARDHALKHGWSKTRLSVTCQGLGILARIQDTPGSRIKASEVNQLDPIVFSRQPILDVLDAAGLLEDDREPSIIDWFDRKIADLPESINNEMRVWFEIMLYGTSSAPRSRPKAHVTIKVRVRSALPAVHAWAAEGRTSLREINRDDVDRMIPSQGSDRALAGTSLRSLFRTLKSKRLVFTNPTTHIKTGRPESRIPLPINENAMRAALESNNPARTALANLIGYHALRSEHVRALLLTDIQDGRIHLPGRTVLLARPVRESLSAWLDHRAIQWPETSNPYLFVTKQSAVRATPVSNVWVIHTLGMSPQALREDRILHEANATQDIRRLCDLFGLSVKGAERYTNTLNPT
ncbi:hypothetical protein [Arthrobacter alpinus]|nr:hypothetical protein [Arthrobacter alpinus]